MTRWHYHARDESMTYQLAAIVARFAQDGTVIGLIGTLGAGKTLFVRGMAQALGVPPDLVVSPTFVLCQEYDCTPKLYHYDAYRLKDPGEFLALGVEEVLGHGGIALIEWSDQVAAALPPDRLEIQFDDIGPGQRSLTLTALGPAAAELLKKVRQMAEQMNHA